MRFFGRETRRFWSDNRRAFSDEKNRSEKASSYSPLLYVIMSFLERSHGSKQSSQIARHRIPVRRNVKRGGED